MACDLATVQEAACDSGIGRLDGQIQLLQVIAQSLATLVDDGDFDDIYARACESGIAKVDNPIQLLQAAAQSLCSLAPTLAMNLFFTLDGSDPTEDSTPYSGPIALASGQTFKIIAIQGGSESEVAQADSATGGENLILENNVLLDSLELSITELDAIQFDEWTAFGHQVEVTINDNPDLESVSFASLTVFGNTNLIASTPTFGITSNPLLANINLGSLDTIRFKGDLDISDNDALVTLDLGSLANVGIADTNEISILVTGHPLLVAPTLGNFLVKNNSTIDFHDNALNAATVNFILARCVASSTFLNGTIDLSGGTNSAPTGQGIADKATLVGRVGLTVTTN